MTTDEMPWPEVLVMLSTFCRPDTASSIGRVICSSTSFGLAPTQAIVTTTTGTSNLGNGLMGRAKNEEMPAAITARKMAMMARGFLTAVCVSHIMSAYSYVDELWTRQVACGRGVLPGPAGAQHRNAFCTKLNFWAAWMARAGSFARAARGLRK